MLVHISQLITAFIFVETQISAIGYNWDQPPAGAAGQRAFLESLNIPEITDVSCLHRRAESPRKARMPWRDAIVQVQSRDLHPLNVVMRNATCS